MPRTVQDLGRLHEVGGEPENTARAIERLADLL